MGINAVLSLSKYGVVFALVMGASTTAVARPGIGVMADVGVPDGATASLVVHPVSMLQLSAGVMNNLVTTGYRGGVAFVPFHRSVISPTASIAYGHYPEGDANPVMQMLLSDPAFSSPLLERFGYDFADFHLGFEVGSQRVRFALAGGMSRITATIHGIDQIANSDDDTTTITLTSEPTVKAWVISARVGFTLFL